MDLFRFRALVRERNSDKAPRALDRLGSPWFDALLFSLRQLAGYHRTTNALPHN